MRTMSSSSNQRLRMSSSRRLKELEAGEWLPDEIMHLVIEKLMVYSPIYLASFFAVCKRWHRLVKEHQINPILLLPVLDWNKDDVSCRIYNLTGQYVPAVNNSLPYGFPRIIGSSFGWLIVTDVDNKSVLLFNPLSKSHIRLPPVSDQRPDLTKGVLSNPPTRSDDGHFDIAITMNRVYSRESRIATRVAFLHVEKIGELESLRWVYHQSLRDGILDVNSIGGEICILYSSGRIRCCKCSKDKFSWYYGVRNVAWPSSMILSNATAYLLESSFSSPRVVLRYKQGYYRNTVNEFKILYLISSNDETMEVNKTWNWTEDKAKQQEHQLRIWNWTEIKTTLGDVIFVSDNADSVCIQAGSNLRFNEGCIYFVDAYNPQGTVGVFNVRQKCFNYFSHRSDDTKFLQREAVWLMPSLC